MKILLITLVVILFAYRITMEDSPLPEPEGRVRGRYGITYGKTANFTQYQFYIRLWLKRGGNTFFCGGTLIDTNKILTAAHCVYGCTEFLACCGSASTYDTSSCFYVNNLSRVCVHRGFHEAMKGGQFHDDLAIITINGNFFQSKGVALAPLCSVCSTSTCDDYEGSVGMTVGCGENENYTLSQVMQEAGQRVVSQAEGLSKFTNLSPPSKYSLCFTKSSTADKRMSTCAGDSGSPVLFLNPVSKRYEVCGVLSFGTADCVSGYPSAFTYIAKYVHFIKWGHECVSLSEINDEAYSVQGSFNSYSINMRPRSEAIWEGTEKKKDSHDNILKPNDDLAMHHIDNKQEETKLNGLKLLFKAVGDFFKALAYG